LIPFFLVKFTAKQVHFFIPIFYLAITFLGLGIGGSFLLPVAGTFIMLKATDYSLFAVAKELLYQPLSTAQKYGAKYIADMVMYRASKGIISAVLIYFQTQLILNSMLAAFLIAWVVVVYLIFKEQRKLAP
jgi:AAA family ATP:ADP antiporter